MRTPFARDQSKNSMKTESPQEAKRPTTKQTHATDTSTSLRKEWGRDRDAEAVFSLKRGVLRILHEKGMIRSALVQASGSKSGQRLWDMKSIAAYLESLTDKPAENAKSLETLAF